MIKLERGKRPDELTDEVCEELKRLYAEDNDKAVWNKLQKDNYRYGKKQRGTCKRSGNRRRKVPGESVESEKEVILRCAQDYHSSSSAAALECV